MLREKDFNKDTKVSSYRVEVFNVLARYVVISSGDAIFLPSFCIPEKEGAEGGAFSRRFVAGRERKTGEQGIKCRYAVERNFMIFVGTM